MSNDKGPTTSQFFKGLFKGLDKDGSIQESVTGFIKEVAAQGEEEDPTTEKNPQVVETSGEGVE